MTYSVCRICGHIDPGVVVVFFGHTCDNCGAVDAAKLKRRAGYEEAWERAEEGKPL